MPWSKNPQNTDGTHETFPIPRTSTEWFRGSANSTVPTTTVEQVRKNAQMQDQSAADCLSRFGLKDVRAGSYVPEKGRK
jgi:hypothetical protein